MHNGTEVVRLLFVGLLRKPKLGLSDVKFHNEHCQTLTTLEGFFSSERRMQKNTLEEG